MKYIRVLADVGASVGSMSETWPHRIEDATPIIYVGDDWQRSYNDIIKYRQKLEELDYDAMYAESQQPNAKDILEGWKSREVPCLTIKYLLGNVRLYHKNMEDAFAYMEGESRRLCTLGKWKIREAENYRWACRDVMRKWKRNVQDLCEYYGYGNNDLSAEQRTLPEQIMNMFALPIQADEFFASTGLTASQWGRRAAAFVRNGKMKIDDGGKINLWRQIVAQQPELGNMKSGYDVFRQQVPRIR